jgi:hypothetical protein
MFYTFKKFVTYIHALKLLCMMNTDLVISAFTSRPISLLGTTKVSEKPHAVKEKVNCSEFPSSEAL